MKNIITLTLILVFTIIFTGCSRSPNVPLNKVNHFNFEDNKRTLYLKVKTDNKDQGIEKVASALRVGAKIMEENGYKYFIIRNKYFIDKFTNGTSPYISNLKDLDSFCFPTESGLEEKCEPFSFKLLKLEIIGQKNPIFLKPTWSTQQVLNDPYVKEKAMFTESVKMARKLMPKKY